MEGNERPRRDGRIMAALRLSGFARGKHRGRHAGSAVTQVLAPDPFRVKMLRPRRYLPRRNTPKADRECYRCREYGAPCTCRFPAAPLVDPMATLGHPPRGRTGRGVGKRVPR